MRSFAAFGCLVLAIWGTSLAEDCSDLLEEMDLPSELRTRGRPRVARWEQVDQVLTRLEEASRDRDCQWTYGKLFKVNRDDVYFPVTNTVLRTAGDDSLNGLAIFSKSGDRLGAFESRVVYERRGGLYGQEGYRLYYFQLRTSEGELSSSGNRLLLDNFTVRWDELKDRPVLFDGDGPPLEARISEQP